MDRRVASPDEFVFGLVEARIVGQVEAQHRDQGRVWVVDRGMVFEPDTPAFGRAVPAKDDLALDRLFGYERSSNLTCCEPPLGRCLSLTSAVDGERRATLSTALGKSPQ